MNASRYLRIGFCLMTFFALLACWDDESNQKNSVEKIKPDVSISDDKKPKSEQDVLESKAILLIDYIKNEKELTTFFADTWEFVYHQDDRCEGSTDGKLGHLKSYEIEKTLHVEVFQDGMGWICDAQTPKRQKISFNFKDNVKKWNRFEGVFSNDKTIFYIFGVDETEYIKIHFNPKGLIRQLVYNIEDPG
jgi:hypothetical protein